ncbi:metallophosphoesterase [Thermus sp. LT1-2-5]|uniref:TIGR00282 family metallophosphoesterase n=1 Tax=Thermus sp. LT1-2-5 TaxID=3026935 RepID=UPI0030E983DB
MKVLFFGDVVGEPGLKALERELPRLRALHQPDFIIANGENLDITEPKLGRAGMSLESLNRLLALGVDAVTGGNHSFDPPWLEEVLGHPRVLRPLNYGPQAPGRGVLLLEKEDQRLQVVNLAGRSALPLVDSPIEAMAQVLAEGPAGAVVVDFHSESVFEKLGFAFLFDGQVAAVLGTHTHVPTADARILPKGTAYVSDVGMVGPEGGMQGYEPQFWVEAQRLRLPPRNLQLRWASGPVRMSYVVLQIEDGKALQIQHSYQIVGV